MTLRLSDDLTVPDDFATQGVAIIGVRGSGKSNTEVRFAELLHGAGIPFVAVDPKGDWYGIRMEGTGPGLPIPVFGGLYGDFPLDEHTGARVADLLVDENLSAVLDVSRLSKTVALPRFLTAFCDRLMARHQEEPHVRSVILEEAHRYIPQVVTQPQRALKEAAASLLLEGRAFGLGCWACTQRPARLHNDVLEEVDTAVIHRIGVTATADLKRVREWVKHEDLGPEVSESLTKLRNGEAWVLSPVALGIVQRTQIARRTTFDSGATPLTGAKRRDLGTMATIDAGAIKEALADTIEKAKANDPKVLHARIRELEHDVATLRAENARVEVVEVPVEVQVPYVPPEVRGGLGMALAQFDEALDALSRAKDTFEYALREVESVPGDTQRREAQPVVDAHRPSPRASRSVPARGATPPAPARPHDDDGYVPKAGARRMLVALATYPAGLTEAQVGTLAKIKRTGGTFSKYMGLLVKAGYVVRSGPLFIATDAGRTVVDIEELPDDPAELRAAWRSRLPGAAKMMFDLLVERYPARWTRQTLADAVDIEIAGGTWSKYLGALRSNGLIEEDGMDLRAHPDLFMGEDR
jgi:hypothetical protein